MKLLLDAKRCCYCDLCLGACPLKPSSLEEMLTSCDFSCKGQMCISACPEGALRCEGEPGAGSLFGWRIWTGEGGIFTVQGLRALSNEEEELAYELKRAYFECAGEKNLDELLEGICADKNVVLDREQRECLKRFVSIDAEWGGPLGILAEDERLEEIAVVGVEKPIFAYIKGKGWVETNCCFTRIEALVEAVNKLSKPIGRRITLSNPRINAVLKNGCRLHASIPPLSEGEVTIRRFREEPFSPAELVANKTFSAEAMALLWLAMESDASIVIAGNTGSGKTSTLNALFSFVPLNERILAMEETPEMRVPHRHFCRLVARDELELGLGEIAADSLRMRPDRVIIGEARDSREAHALFEAMLSGQARGCYATLHARSPEEAIARICALGIPERDICALDLIVIQRRIALHSGGGFAEVRRCMNICGVEWEGERAKTKAIYSFDFGDRVLKRVSLEGKVSNKICETFNFTSEGLEAELKRRANLIANLASMRADFNACLHELNRCG